MTNPTQVHKVSQNGAAAIHVEELRRQTAESGALEKIFLSIVDAEEQVKAVHKTAISP